MNTALRFLLLLVAIPLLIPIVPLLLLWFVVWGAVLRLWFWWVHASRGRTVLFVYSESPNWQTYIEANILPHIQDRSVVLNWSDRRNWTATCPWEGRFIRRFGGANEFNPIALVYRQARIRPIRFHQAFLDYKHGKPTTLQTAEAELFAAVDAPQASPSARR